MFHTNASRRGTQWCEFPSSEPRLSLHHLYKSLAAHASFLSFFFINSTYWDYVFFFFICQEHSWQDSISLYPMQLSNSICSVFLPFLEEPLVICWELLLSCKSNFIPPDKMCTVFVCACVLAFVFFVRIQCVWADTDTHGNLGKTLKWMCSCTCFLPSFISIRINCECLWVTEPTDILYSTITQKN